MHDTPPDPRLRGVCRGVWPCPGRPGGAWPMTPAPDTPAEPLRGPLWPFPPELLDYPSLPPCARPVGRVTPPADAEPALF